MSCNIREMEKQEQGLTQILTFKVHSPSYNLGDSVTSDEININDLAWVSFTFTLLSIKCYGRYELESTMIFKKHEIAKTASVKINLSCGEFKKECICPDDGINEVKINTSIKSYALTWIVKVILQVTVDRNEVRISPINKLFEDTEFTDFQLCAADGSVAVHKSILSVYSDMFKAMLRGEWKETAEGRIEVPGVTVQTLRHLKEYMYLGTLPDEGLEPLLLLAVHYFMDTVRADCITKLVERVRPGNVDGLIEFACENNLPDLMKCILLKTRVRVD